MEPGYRQVWGLTQSLGGVAIPFPLDPEAGWRPRLDQLADAARGGLKAISVVNPNNPTGSVLTDPERARLVAIAGSTGAWLLADEVYRGVERHTDAETRTIWGDYDRVVAVGSLSKAYGLAGLRLGWIVAPVDLIGPLWRRHEYAVISAAGPSMRVAELALANPMRARLLDRQRGLSRAGWRLMDGWLAEQADLVSVGASEATSMAFIRYRLPLSSVAVADRIRRDASVLVAPGEFLGADHHLRVTHGLGAEYVTEALGRIAAVLRRLAAEQPVAAR
jgi:aspartate/methionine/tyrosine aminotransferase